MADVPDDSRQNRPHSPREDFDPLSDNGNQPSSTVYGEDYYDYIEAQLDQDDEEGGQDSLGSRYGVTPPNSRAQKREKERQASATRGSYVKRSYKDYKEYVAAKRKGQPRAVLNVIKDANLGDPTLCKLSGFDSDENIDAENFREKKEKRKRDTREAKKQTKSRENDRFMKRMSDSFSGLDVGSMAQVPVKLESSGRFSHLMTRPIAISSDYRARRHWTEPRECPEDRKKFSETFSMLIKLGTDAKMLKERKLQSTKRQMSSEQEQWKSQLMDYLWIELNAYLRGVTLEDEQTQLRMSREAVQKVLDDINNFQFRHRNPSRTPSDGAFFAGSDVASMIAQGIGGSSSGEATPTASFSSDHGDHHVSVGQTTQCGRRISQDTQGSSIDSQATPTGSIDTVNRAESDNTLSVPLEDSVSASFHDVVLTSETLRLQEEALIQVKKLVERLDACERQYPTMRQITLDYPLYGDAAFTRRIKCLNLWLNITCDLCHKLKLFGRVIGVEQHGIDWPTINFEFPVPGDSDHYQGGKRPSVPNIEENDETSESDLNEDDDGDDEEEEEGDNESKVEADQGRPGVRFLSPTKQVKFTFGSDSATSSRDTSPNQRNSGLLEPVSPVDSSTPQRNSRSSMGSFGNLSRASSDLSLDGLGRSAVYRHYVDKCLKKMGMHKLVLRLRDIFNCSLQRAKEALESPRHHAPAPDLKRYPSDEAGLHENEMASSPTMNQARMYFGRSTSLAEHGEWCQEFRRMGLPSFRPTYLFLVRIPLDVVHECLRLRLEQRPQGDPSFLSIRQLIRECKEVLYAATVVKQYYQFMVDPVMWDEQEAEEKFASDLERFDEDLKSMLEVYFSFLQSWIYMLQSLPEGSQDLKSALEDEWEFTRSICIYIIGGEAEAGKRFSSMASSLLSFTADFLDNGIDENTRSLYDVSGVESEEGEEPENNDNNNNDSTPSIECDDNRSRPRISAEVKQSVQVALRGFKNLFHEARERASKALGFAKKLRKDLEIAADFNVVVTMRELFDKLKATDHVRVRAPLSAGYMMFVPQRIVGNTRLILQLLNVTSGRDDGLCPVDIPNIREEGYLLLICCEAGADHEPVCPRWDGQDVNVEPTAETTIALSHIQLEGLLYVVIHSSSLGSRRKEFQRIMGNTVALVYEQTPCHQAIAESLSEVKLNALELQEKVAEAVRQVDDKLNFNDVIQHEDNLLKLYRETMLQCYNFGFEYSKEVMRLIASDQRERQCHTLVAFAGDWMSFVLQKCERGRGTRPRWATHGLDFLTSVCDPKFLAYITNQDFEKFKQTISDCLTHVIGTMEQRPIGAGISIVSKSSMELRPQGIQRFVSWPEPGGAGKFQRSTSARSVSSEPSGHVPASGLSTPSTPSPQPDPPSAGELQLSLTRRERIRRKVDHMERERDDQLLEKKRIGRVTNKVREPDYRINMRRVNFRWQRGNKIGEGQFGKVYTAVNMSTGELMAIKEMKFQPNDLQQLRQMCDEIKIFEGIQHPNLVKYYGVEVHKDEMLMFMEYCDTGTIEEAAKMGLPEYLIRRYTREIILAVNHLHENSIVHRDIKGANIFLTSNGHVKLGDFGCSVKLKSHTTMPGEFHNLVGTTAYMAPEVITNDQSGYGRAADIWSLGCVVIEMSTGKRPWHELENHYQVMFKVGMGHKPAVPDSLSPEGKEFLDLTLKHDPTMRPSANNLLDHTFTKVYNEPEEDEELEKHKKRKEHLLRKRSSEET
ncbi:mitogen-activated protein kinase kinase kinase 4-like isoform X2 [Littorina saxatilis]|uniref:Mitogen-activated protein kinase kinase kinase 4 n=1 Tax=Littorina saxatilis TaxID=31220 RepID=A0AAN9BL57_9CAEN